MFRSALFTPRRALGQAATDDRGMMLVEVLVSAVSLVGLGLATFSLIDGAGSATAMNRARSVATALAQNDQDQMRQLPYQELLNRPAAARNLVVDGRSYSVKSELAWIDDTVGTSDCSSTSKSARYLKMTTSVTSDGSGLDVPVKLETMRAPTLASVGSGSVAIRLTRGDGTGTDAVPVFAGPVSGTTNVNGCAFLDEVSEGAIAMSWSRLGYVNENGLTNVTSTVAVRTDTTSVVTGSYDIAGAANVAFTNKRIADPGTITAADRSKWRTVSSVNQGITSVPVGKRRFAAASAVNTITASNLFPFSNDYGFYAGNCDGNNPEAYVDGSGVSGAVAPGATKQVAVDLQTINVTVRNGGGYRVGYRVYAAPNTNPISPNPASTMGECTEGLYRSSTSAGVLPAATSSTGQTKVDLPYGIWDLCIDNNIGGGSARRYSVRINNTPEGSPSPLAPTKISGVRAVSLNTQSGSSTGLCA